MDVEDLLAHQATACGDVARAGAVTSERYLCPVTTVVVNPPYSVPSKSGETLGIHVGNVWPHAPPAFTAARRFVPGLLHAGGSQKLLVSIPQNPEADGWYPITIFEQGSSCCSLGFILLVAFGWRASS